MPDEKSNAWLSLWKPHTLRRENLVFKSILNSCLKKRECLYMQKIKSMSKVESYLRKQVETLGLLFLRASCCTRSGMNRQRNRRRWNVWVQISAAPIPRESRWSARLHKHSIARCAFSSGESIPIEWPGMDSQHTRISKSPSSSFVWFPNPGE